MASPSSSVVTSVLTSQVVFKRLPDEEKEKFEKYKDLYNKDYLGFYGQEGKYFEGLAEDLYGDSVSF